MKPQDIKQEERSLWIFGYGSLAWNPGFAHKRSTVGYIQGYKRRFWHGDDFYRGNKEQLARVATLVEDQEACTWGVAYEVTDSQIEESRQYLNKREGVMGGYVTEMVEFIPKETSQGPQAALVYIATSDNPIYLGPASVKEIAAQISLCSGTTGPNIEYLVHLAEFMRLYCPGVEDEHLFSIEAAVLSIFRGAGGTKTSEQSPLLLPAQGTAPFNLGSCFS